MLAMTSMIALIALIAQAGQKVEVELRGGQRLEVRLQRLRSLRFMARFAPQGSYLCNLTSYL
jgi:hypothetical protein